MSNDQKILKAKSNGIIEVTNNWLGYKLFYEIRQCEINLQEHSFINYGYAHFVDLSGGDKKFELRRKEKYCGSLNHFLRTLYSNEHTENGFEVKRARITKNTEKERVKALMKRHSYQVNFSFETIGSKRVPGDSAKYYYKAYISQNKYSVVSDPGLLTADSLFITDLEIFKELSFKDYILISYKNKASEQSITNGMPELALMNKYESSLLKLSDENSVLLYPTGRLDPPKSLIIAGGWANSNAVSHLLPQDFLCDCKNIKQ